MARNLMFFSAEKNARIGQRRARRLIRQVLHSALIARIPHPLRLLNLNFPSKAPPQSRGVGSPNKRDLHAALVVLLVLSTLGPDQALAAPQRISLSARVLGHLPWRDPVKIQSPPKNPVVWSVLIDTSTMFDGKIRSRFAKFCVKNCGTKYPLVKVDPTTVKIGRRINLKGYWIRNKSLGTPLFFVVSSAQVFASRPAEAPTPTPIPIRTPTLTPTPSPTRSSAESATLTLETSVNPAGTRYIRLSQATAPLDLFSDGVNVPVTVKYSGTMPASGITLSGLEAPFDFAGGAYPGTGGTCGTEITGPCTLMLNFKPGQAVSPGTSRKLSTYTNYSKTVTLTYSSGGQQKSDDGVVLVGSSLNPAEIRLALHPCPGQSEIGEFGSLLVGRSSCRTIRVSVPISSTDGGATYTQEARNVRVSLASGSYFFIKRNTCSSTLTPGWDRCEIDVEFRPLAEQAYQDVVNVTYDAGINNPQSSSRNIRGEGFQPTPDRNLLVVYNSASPESTDLKNYYIANRPGFSNANVLAVNFRGTSCLHRSYANWVYKEETYDDPNCDTMNLSDFNSLLRDPVMNWIESHPDKDIRHIVIVYMADRLNPAQGAVAYGLNLALVRTGKTIGATFPPFLGSEQPGGGPPYNGYYTRWNYPGTMALVTYLWMGSVEATKAYVDKLHDVWSRMPAKNVVISAQGTNYGGDRYYFEDTNSIGPKGEPSTGIEKRNAVLAANPTAIVTVTGRNDPYISEAHDVAGYMSWGTNGGHPWHYANDGTVLFTGRSNWYLIQTYESFNGFRDSPQGDFTDWFAANAFGGTNYEHTPVGAVTHVEEPMVSGVNGPPYFECFEKGHLFIDCAYISMKSGFMIPRGDPWITK